ncbi:MAG TPA: M1 family aminopeptidase [Polyangiaceae bacterium]|jgi:aminopeptidase N|nr:M1 family aminopeptidase [Polyangiaceae bacterium]
MRALRFFGPALILAPCLLLGCSSDPATSTGSGGSSTASGTGGAGGAGGMDGAGGAGGSGGAVAPPTGLINAPVHRYDYAFDITTLAARSRLTIDVPAPGGDCYNVSCALPAVTEPTWNGAPASSSTLDQQMLSLCGDGVPGGSPLEIGASGTVLQKTSFGLDVGFSRSKDLAGGEFSYLLSWVGGCDRFGPCDDHPSRLAEFHFEVTHPPGHVVLCPGVLTPGETLTRCDLAGTLAPTYSAFAVASDPLWKASPFATAAGVNIVFYEVPGGSIASSLDKASVTEFMTWITGLLGPFPYGDELRVAGAPTTWFGFEHPANIILLEDLPLYVSPYKNTPMHVLMHEIIHQWAGDRTTLATAEDFVWKEATAEYLAYVFEDEKRPAGEASASLSYWDQVSLNANYYPRPTDDPPPAVQAFYGDVYGPGPMILYVQLETMLGRPAVLAGIASFLSEPGARSVADLRSALEKASGKDLAAYFDAWVFGSGAPERPTFSVELSQVGAEVTVALTQMNPSKKLYGCAVEVEVKGAVSSARALVDFGLAPSSPTASAKVTLAEPITSHTLDPDHRLVAMDASVMPAAPPPKLPAWTF